MPTLWSAERHQPLAEIAWDEAAARAGIERIVASARAAFTPEGLWPLHLDDGPPEWGALTGLYFGAVGMVWGLDYLQRQGAAAPGETFAGALDVIAERHERFIAAFAGMGAGYLLGRSAPMLLQWKQSRDPVLADQLAELIAGNTESQARELMWGAPGTMLVALAMHEQTGEARWAELIRAGAAALGGTFADDAQLSAGIWTQQLYGQSVRYLGAVHGLAGNAYVLQRVAHLLEPAAAARWSAALARSLETSAIRSDGLANWPAKLDDPGAATPTPLLVQHCHGAPGMVTSFAAIPAADEALLIEGGELTWRAGPLVKGSNLCHGTAGNGYAFLKLFERTGDELWLGRARAFAMHALAQCDAQATELGRGRYSLWTGDLGLACYLWDCVQGKAAFPTLDVV